MLGSVSAANKHRTIRHGRIFPWMLLDVNEMKLTEEERIEILERKLAIAVEALRGLSKCIGGCEGPLGCMCRSGMAKEALEKIKL